MAYQAVWYYTNIPQKIIDTIEEDLAENFDNNLEPSKVYDGGVNKEKRNSRNSWIPTTHWVAGFVWHYVQRANRENFLYDLSHIDGETLQYTHYGPGEYYGWHIDAGLSNAFKPSFDGSSETYQQRGQDFVNQNCELIRKLSFVLQLSDPEDYEGGNLQLLDEELKPYIAPRQKGTLILFDSRTQHRVLKVTKGLRKSIVGWTVGPRWK